MGGLLSLLRGSNKDSEILGKNASDSEVLGGIYKLMVQKENLNRLDYEKRKNYAEEQDIEQARRHAEIVKALTVRRKPAPKKAKAKKPFRLPTLPGRKPVPRVTKPGAPAAPKPAPVPKPAEPTAPTVPKPSAPAPNTAAQEAARRAQEETARKAREEATRKAQEESARKAREEATRKAQEESARKAREEAVRKSQEEAARKTQEEAARKAREAAEAARKAREAREAAEAAKKAKDAEETARKAREAAEAAKKAKDAEEAAKKAREAAEAARKAREAAEAAKKTREAEETAKKAREAAESARKAREAAEAAKKAREVDKRRNDRTTEEEKGVRAAGEAAKREADRRAREEATRKAREEAARKSAERVERKPDQPPTAQPAAPSAPPSATRVPSAPAAAVAIGALTGTSAVMSAIAGAEGGKKYDISFGDVVMKDGTLKNRLRDKPGGTFLNLKTPEEWSEETLGKKKKLTQMTLKEVLEFTRYRSKTWPSSGAVGTYGFMPSTLFGKNFMTNNDPQKSIGGELKASGIMDWDKTLFNKETQDFLAVPLLQRNLRTISAAGVPTTPGWAYMSWYTGPGGAIAVWKAIQSGKGNEKVGKILSDAKVPWAPNVNPELGAEEFNGPAGKRVKNTALNFPIVLENRLKEKGGLHMSPEGLPTILQQTNNGQKVSDVSMQNSDMRKMMNASSSSTVVINQQNTVAGNATQQQNRDVVDDSSPYSRKSRA